VFRRRAPIALIAVMLGFAAASATAFAAPAGVSGPVGVSGPALTGNLLVLLDRSAASSAAVGTVKGVLARAGARLAGRSVPEIGLITVRPPAGVPPAALARVLRLLPGVASVELERRYVPRAIPNDPALTATDPVTGVVQWYLAREGFYRAWSITHGAGALVGVIDTGIDATHPDLASKLAVPPIDQQDPSDDSGPAGTDQVGHGTHVASLACAATNNHLGMAGAGYDCQLVIEKTDFSDSSIANSIVDATKRGVQAINMSFGPSMATTDAAPAAEVRALDYAAAHKVVLVAAAADYPGSEEGDPANVVQPAGTGQNINGGIGLDVTAADFRGARASFAGFGSEISLAAFGAVEPDAFAGAGAGPEPEPGLFGAFPGTLTQLELSPSPCYCRTSFGGDNRYAYLQGTSMAAPQVAATAAMMRVLNPYASLHDVLRLLKQTATRTGGWSSDLGWGILNAGAALDAIRRLDRLAPVSRLRAPARTRSLTFTLTWSGHDQTRPGLIASGIDYYDVYVVTPGAGRRLLAGTRRHSLRFTGRRGRRYSFYSVAVDRAGNREAHPVRVTTVVG
jgi:serine protease